ARRYFRLASLRPPTSVLFPYTTLFRSADVGEEDRQLAVAALERAPAQRIVRHLFDERRRDVLAEAGDHLSPRASLGEPADDEVEEPEREQRGERRGDRKHEPQVRPRDGVRA